MVEERAKKTMLKIINELCYVFQKLANDEDLMMNAEYAIHMQAMITTLTIFNSKILFYMLKMHDTERNTIALPELLLEHVLEEIRKEVRSKLNEQITAEVYKNA